MAQPSNLLLKQARQLFPDTTERERFVQALIQPQPFQPAILWCKPPIAVFATEPPLAWQPPFVDRLHLGQQPGKHPLHDQGAYYCLDFSSVFAASVLLSLPKMPKLIFDMCAAPGGKSIFAWQALQPHLLLANEVVGKRMGALLSNLRRCGLTPAALMTVDSQIVAEVIPMTADLVLVDAPCSGQSLLAKGKLNPGCFHPVNINKNANRQKRILANSAQLVMPNGCLVYMTCTYAREENEQVIEWLLERFPEFQPIAIAPLQVYQSQLAEFPCYRMFPQDRLGAGAFTVVLRNTTRGQRRELPTHFLQQSRITQL
ncbi:MAG: RsmB/NOP family class I SAM-dependent RNA methyltransferase [Synechococcales bacterium]|nr:RsmB/NOP family class I SAM-dependent RNA methyltransferase [Synechococcales bacterium]